MKSGWLEELVDVNSGEVVSSCFVVSNPRMGTSSVEDLEWRATEVIDPNVVTKMVTDCVRVDIDEDGWYAVIDDVAADCLHSGRGATAWEAVKGAHLAFSRSKESTELPRESDMLAHDQWTKFSNHISVIKDN